MSAVCGFCHVRKDKQECLYVHCYFWMCLPCVRICIAADCPLVTITTHGLLRIKCPSCQ
jgi:hypothetical protein